MTPRHAKEPAHPDSEPAIPDRPTDAEERLQETPEGQTNLVDPVNGPVDPEQTALQSEDGRPEGGGG